MFPVDKEELRSDRGVKVSKKEINLLHFDGEEFVDMVKPVVEQPKKKKSLDSPLRTSSFNNSMVSLCKRNYIGKGDPKWATLFFFFFTYKQSKHY